MNDKGGSILVAAFDAEFPYDYSAGRYASYFFKKLKEEKKIMGIRCPKCERVFVPPRPVCGYCFVKNTDWVDLGFTSPAGTMEHRLTASAAGLFVGFVFFTDAGTTQVAVARRASGRWQTLGPFSPAGEGAGQMRLIADDRGQVFLSYLTNDTPFSWMYMLAAWNGRWHQLGHALQGSLYDYLDNASMVPSPEGLPAFALLESSEYNLDLWVYLPNP